MDSLKNAIEAVYPLTSTQEGILFHSTLSTGTGVYVIQRLSMLPPDLDRALFKQSWQQVLQRHSILRTAFLFESAKKPLQVVGRQVQLPWEEDDWRLLAPVAEQEQLESLLKADRERGFELTQAPLMRLRLVQRRDGSYYCLWSFHHAILDGWSWPLVLKEVYTSYARTSRGQETSLTVTQPYQSYIAWLQQQDLGSAEQFWRAYLRGISVPTILGEPGEESQERIYARYQIQLASPLVAAVHTMMQRYHLTMNTLFSGAWALLLSCYSNEEEVIFGTAVSGRPPELPGIEEMVGMFINTLPVRVRIVKGQSVFSWLQDLQQQLAELRQYEYSPLVQVQKWSEVPGGTPLFEHVFACAPAQSTLDPEDAIFLETGEARFIESSNYPLGIEVASGGQCVIHATYDVDRFEEGMIQRMLEHMRTLVEKMTAAPTHPLALLSPLTERERQHIVRDWNATTTAYPDTLRVSDLFQSQAREQPDAIALAFEDLQLTYSMMDRLAHRMAHHLQQHGVGPEVLVGVSVERSCEMVLAVLGVLYAGGTYVPLDPGYPQDRLEYMCTHAQLAVLITQRHLVPRLPLFKSPLVFFDSPADLPEGEPRVISTAQPDNLAYVIYTSGSTGRPKGVMLPHRGLCSLVVAQSCAFGHQRGKQILQFSSLSFDASIWEIVMTLGMGGTLVLASQTTLLPGPDLQRILHERGINTVTLPPSVLASLPQIELPELETLITAGEACTTDSIARWSTNGRHFYNAYGPTETTVCASVSLCKPDGKRPTIGTPIANMQMYVLDHFLQPVPIGVPGELYLGGIGLARGYQGAPDMTAERFLPDPFGPQAGARLYRTGDRTRLRADGAIEFVGRVDRQVKIRGYRIELGEIEMVLSQHPLVREVVVEVQERVLGQKQLVAYVVSAELDAERQPSITTEIQHFLQQRLPVYMVPSLIFLLEALPLTPGGKIDRRALPELEKLLWERTEEYIEPRTETERQLVAIWQQALQVERIGIQSDFFAIGGDSIQSVRVIVCARQAGITLTPQQLFQYPTIAQLAPIVEQTISRQVSQPIGNTLPLTPIQRWFFERHLPASNYWNQSFLFTAREHLDPSLLRASVRILLERHDALQFRFSQEGNVWKQWHAQPAEDVPLTIFDCTQLAIEEQDLWIRARITELQGSLHLSNGPLLRVALFDHGSEQQQQVLFIIHHLAVDITSWRILLSDWHSAYQQLRANLPVQLPLVATSFQRWMEHLEAYTRSLRLMRERTYWLNQPWSQVKRVPVDVPDGKNTEKYARTLSGILSAKETHVLIYEASRVYHMQIHEILLTALVQACTRWMDSQVLLVELEGHGREDIVEGVDLVRTVGWFTALVPLCLRIGQQQAVGEMLLEVKKQVRALPQGGIGYGLLRYSSQDEEIKEKLATLPRAEVVFNYEGRSANPLEEGTLLVPQEDVDLHARYPESGRSHVLAFTGQLRDDCFCMKITYSEQVHHAATIKMLLGWYLEALRAILGHCQGQEKEHFTPEDFPEAKLDQEDLEKVMASVYEDMEV